MRLAGVDLTVIRYGLGLSNSRESNELDTTRARWIALNKAFLRERLQKIRYRLCRLDLELLTDIANTRLIRVFSREVEKILINRALELTQLLCHHSNGTPVPCPWKWRCRI